jgi:hypothetical protein
VRHQSKWSARSANSSIAYPFFSPSEDAIEEVTCPIGWDRTKAAAWKGKGKKAQVVKVSISPQ